MFPRILMLTAIATCGIVPALSQEGPKATPPIFQEDPGALMRYWYGPNPSEEVITEICKAKCDRPCANWARGQTNFQFSYKACMAKCQNKDYPWCP